jgi:hypothetical protein
MSRANKPQHRLTRKSRSNGGKALRGGEFADEVRQRALIDAKGAVLREGAFYTAEQPEGCDWQKRRAIFGRTDQIELVYAGRVRATTGETQLKNSRQWLSGK